MHFPEFILDCPFLSSGCDFPLWAIARIPLIFYISPFPFNSLPDIFSFVRPRSIQFFLSPTCLDYIGSQKEKLFFWCNCCLLNILIDHMSFTAKVVATDKCVHKVIQLLSQLLSTKWGMDKYSKCWNIFLILWVPGNCLFHLRCLHIGLDAITLSLEPMREEPMGS